MSVSTRTKPSRLSHLKFIRPQQWLLMAGVFVLVMACMNLILGDYWNVPSRLERGVFLAFSLIVPFMASYLTYANLADEAKDRLKTHLSHNESAVTCV